MLVFVIVSLFGCKDQKEESKSIKPFITTDKVGFDSDDPAIWINYQNPSLSLVIGTDKGGESGEGGLYVFDLDGKIDTSKTVRLQRPNNVDVAYGLKMADRMTDIAVCTERNTNKIRVFSLPDMLAIDGGGIEVFVDDTLRSPMGIALFTDLKTNNIYAMVGRKTGPKTGYIYQYLLSTDNSNTVKGQLVRKFGNFSGLKEVEAIVVDNELGYLYCSDEGVGVRKYYAHPDSNNIELALFATNDVSEDHEGLSIYKANDGTGYIILSDQQSDQFLIYPREGSKENKHQHQLIKTIKTNTDESDGSDVTNIPLNDAFRNGLFVAMSTDGTFQYYRWEDLADKDLFLAPAGIKMK